MKIFTKIYELSDEEFDFLSSLKDGYAEYRDSEYVDLEDFRARGDKSRTEEWFLARNCNGTYKIACKLADIDFIIHNDESWHITYILSELGKEAVEQITSLQYKRNETLEKLDI